MKSSGVSTQMRRDETMLPANVVKELESIRRRSPDKTLTADAVLESAETKRDSPLRAYFTWDDGAAARLHRLSEARELIRCHVVILPGEARPVRAFVSLPSDRDTTTGYRRTADVLEHAVQRAEMISVALATLSQVRQRFCFLDELRPVFDDVDGIVEIARAKLAAKVNAA